MLSAMAPAALSANQIRCERTGSSAAAAVSQMVNGNQMRSTSALLSMLRSAHTTAASTPNNSR